MKRTKKLHNGTTWVKRDEKGEVVDKFNGNDPAWRSHADKEMKRRMKSNKVAKRSRKRNRPK